MAGLLDKLSQPQNDLDAQEGKDDEQNENVEEAQDDESQTQELSTDNITAQELNQIIEQIVEAKIAKLEATIENKAKRTQDTYAEVSKVLGTSFDYQGKSINDLYKFGYEALTRQKLQDGLDPKTAFKMASANKANGTKAKMSDSSTQIFSKLDSLITQHK